MYIPPEGVTAFLALLGAAIGAYLTHRFNRKRDHLELKRDVLRRVMGYRWNLTEGRQEPQGQFFTALNEAFVVFAGDRKVVCELRSFSGEIREGFRAKHLYSLTKAMARSAKVPHKEWDVELFEHPYTPPHTKWVVRNSC